MAAILLASIVLVLLAFTNAEYEIEKYCKLTQPGIKLPSSDSCEEYYTCGLDEKPSKESCPSNLVFSKDAQGCVPVSEGNCFFGFSNPCQNKHREYSYSSKGCNWYSYCYDGKVANNYTCPAGQRFNAAQNICVNGNCGSSKQSAVLDICNIMPENVYFGDFENCRAWYQCIGSQLRSGFCGSDGQNDLVFDVITGTCPPNNGNMCQRTKNSVENVASGPPNRLCTGPAEVVADANVCSIYYVCEPSTPAGTFRWAERKCRNQFFDVISMTCSGTQQAKTFPTCDRCQFKASSASVYFVNAVDSSCEYYFTCKNSRAVSTKPRTCGNRFFNERLQGCDADEAKLEIYKQNNGACQEYSCNEDRTCSLPNTDKPAIPEAPTENPSSVEHPANQEKPQDHQETQPVKPETQNGTQEENVVKPADQEKAPGDQGSNPTGEKSER